ncbi:tRNA lysidine(34) synthetase TilS [Parabacteroides chinchillae]|uniref:tRNA(Ile)-lysidine synthase n=1 Tax=Parabacteroides chinchillae TaxID=871327 RepID=A0A8G2BZ35_9BACT|nr:tRNA lysidine(34) synthetase TilS [Parabacteroides chinchillae]SEG28010.1 tRNA(Ile)-lysidine synthase [Parabacteroides chinchillae]
MINTIRTYIEKHRLLADDGRPVLVGLSGGADSVALLALLVRLDYPCMAVHCNFHLRGDESIRDEHFAKDFAGSLHVPFYKVDFDTTAYAGEKHISIEMAARELRYTWFEGMRCKLDAQAIAVAHHRDDSVETLLMNLIRGTGVRGMRGIRPKNGYIVRPLLPVSREEILKWLAEQHYSYVTDSTNLSDAYTRNFIRLRVLPLLEEINPAVRNTIARTAEHLSAVETIYNNVIENARNQIMVTEDSLSVKTLLTFPLPDTILYELLKPFNFTRLVTDDIYLSLRGESGRQFYSSTHRLIKDRDYLFLSSLQEKEAKIYILDEKTTECSEPVELSFRKIVLNKEFHIEKNKHIAYFDYDKLTFPLSLRTWQEGDWFIPFGMTGRKKLSDYFSDHKYTIFQKEQTWLLCSGDNIIWLVGERSDNRFRIDKTTKHILIVKFFC